MSKAKKAFGMLGMVLGYSIGIPAFIMMLIWWFTIMYQWLGILGIFLATILMPGAGISPFIYWIVTGIFPVKYFLFWGAAIVGGLIGAGSAHFYEEE